MLNINILIYIHSEYTSVYSLPCGLFHGSECIPDTELKTQPVARRRYSLAEIDPNASGHFELRSNPNLNFHEASSAEAHLRRFLIGCLKDFSITLGKSVENVLILVKIPTEKKMILHFSPVLETML